jgi:hypothetical protein
MTEQQFLERLTAELADRAGDPALAELIDDLRAHFAEARHRGQSDADVAAALGDPAEIAAGFREAVDGSGAGEPAASGDAAAAPPPDAPARLAVTAHLHAANLVVRGTAVDRPRVTVFQGGQPVDQSRIHVEDLDGSLRLTQTPVSVAERIFGWLGYTVEIDLPTPLAGGLDLRVAAGNVTLSDVAANGPAAVDVTAGTARLTAVSAPELRVSSRAGNVELWRCAGDAEAHSQAGNAHVDSPRGTVGASSKAGNVRVTTDTMARPAHCEAAMGNARVEVERLAAPLTVRSRAGNVVLAVGTVAADLTARADCGNVKAALGDAGAARFVLHGAGVHNAFPEAAHRDGVPTVDLAAWLGSVKVTRR